MQSKVKQHLKDASNMSFTDIVSVQQSWWVRPSALASKLSALQSMSATKHQMLHCKQAKQLTTNPRKAINKQTASYPLATTSQNQWQLKSNANLNRWSSTSNNHHITKGGGLRLFTLSYDPSNNVCHYYHQYDDGPTMQRDCALASQQRVLPVPTVPGVYHLYHDRPVQLQTLCQLAQATIRLLCTGCTSRLWEITVIDLGPQLQILGLISNINGTFGTDTPLSLTPRGFWPVPLLSQSWYS